MGLCAEGCWLCDGLVLGCGGKKQPIRQRPFLAFGVWLLFIVGRGGVEGQLPIIGW